MTVKNISIFVFGLDEIDKKIIKEYQENPSQTHSQIATKVKLSQPAVGNRINRLEKDGLLCCQMGINLKDKKMRDSYTETLIESILKN